MKEIVLTNCEKKFVLDAAAENTRLDGRKQDECRKIEICFGSELGSCVVTLGETKVLAQVSCEVAEPRTTRPNEGILFINVELNQMAACHFETGRSSELGVHINRVLERCFKDSKAVDLESLCIVAEDKVWVLRVDINVLNHEGNLIDCASIASLAALMYFKRPDVTTDGNDITVHSTSDRDPIPLTLHHYPVCVSFAFLNNGENILIDPTSIEERVADAHLVFGVNSYKELCGIHYGGTALTKTKLILKCSSKAAARSREVVEIIKESLARHQATDNSNGLVNCLKENEDGVRLKIQLRGVKQNSHILEHEQQNEEHDKMDMIEVKEGVVDDEDDDVQIISLEGQSAEMITPVTDKKIKTKHVFAPQSLTKFGEGGPSTWEVDLEAVGSHLLKEESNSDGEDDVQYVPHSKQEKSVDNIVLSGDSEEEVMVLKNIEKVENYIPAPRTTKNKKPRKRRQK